MRLGPLEYTVIGFDKPTFDGSIAEEIGKVVEKRIIRLVDVVFVEKDLGVRHARLDYVRDELRSRSPQAIAAEVHEVGAVFGRPHDRRVRARGSRRHDDRPVAHDAEPDAHEIRAAHGLPPTCSGLPTGAHQLALT